MSPDVTQHQDIDAAALSDLVALRRDLHAHPELGFEEVRTSGIVRDVLVGLGIDVTDGIGRTGVVGTLDCGPGPAIALRADMDALAMPETAERPYKSTVPGQMHACGHDGHTVMLLGAARQLAANPPRSGVVHFVFQPAEEGRGGAKAMVEDGLFDRFRIERFYGLHNMPGIPVGQIAISPGPQLASSDRWQAVFRGVGTHGGKPHLGRDPIIAAGQFLTAIQTLVSRNIDPVEAAVVSACAIEAGDFNALNVIPDSVRIGGTARAYAATARDAVEAGLARMARGIAAANGIEATLDYRRQLDPVINDSHTSRIAASAARRAFGASNVLTDFPPSTAGDDFAVFSARVPGAYVWLGNGPAEDGALHHNTRYDFNDDAIEPGMRYWTALVHEELGVA